MQTQGELDDSISCVGTPTFAGGGQESERVASVILIWGSDETKEEAR
jgi:hypothetical protein